MPSSRGLASFSSVSSHLVHLSDKIMLMTKPSSQGLVSLTVEFFRSNASDCLDPSGKPISFGDFAIGITTCNLPCTTDLGPKSYLRLDASNNIYVIPAPTVLSFGTATLVSAACCIPAILHLITMWNKILKINWKSRFGDDEEKRRDEPIKGTGATFGTLKTIEGAIKGFMKVVEIPFFGAAVLAILGFGEWNFWSHQVHYQTEPMTSVGR
jgi:hypothetical protein